LEGLQILPQGQVGPSIWSPAQQQAQTAEKRQFAAAAPLAVILGRYCVQLVHLLQAIQVVLQLPHDRAAVAARFRSWPKDVTVILPWLLVRELWVAL
jgi:hypothetical protein